ncbi:MAG: general secretion pathway protein GspB [Marinobacter sp.]|uniref:general secretion pathway protein GspB n=1 Tax=Marinobacter sp. TaxID=50741 RepID=UPI0034A0980A
MSYILDALRKSEDERRQGRVPDLGQQVQLIHRPKKKAIPVTAWVGIGLILNACILAAIFWPGIGLMSLGVSLSSDKKSSEPASINGDEFVPAPVLDPASVQPDKEPQVLQPVAAGSEESIDSDVNSPSPELVNESEERPTLIVPSWNAPLEDYPGSAGRDERFASSERVPHLVELPMSFQRRIPNLIFSSHIYASDPAARRVMINDNYLRPGERFAGIRVDRITAEGVELSLDGQRFRVGVVRDWISPR